MTLHLIDTIYEPYNYSKQLITSTIFSLVFFWAKKKLVGLERKLSAPSVFLPNLFPNQIVEDLCFPSSFLFFPIFFPLFHPNKHTLRVNIL